jgi:hypothetical protein
MPSNSSIAPDYSRSFAPTNRFSRSRILWESESRSISSISSATFSAFHVCFPQVSRQKLRGLECLGDPLPDAGFRIVCLAGCATPGECRDEAGRDKSNFVDFHSALRCRGGKRGRKKGISPISLGRKKGISPISLVLLGPSVPWTLIASFAVALGGVGRDSKCFFVVRRRAGVFGPGQPSPGWPGFARGRARFSIPGMRSRIDATEADDDGNRRIWPMEVRRHGGACLRRAMFSTSSGFPHKRRCRRCRPRAARTSPHIRISGLSN